MNFLEVAGTYPENTKFDSQTPSGLLQSPAPKRAPAHGNPDDSVAGYFKY
jgi:hypothetical protein